MPNLQNIRDFSAAEGISEQVARRLCREGEIPHVKIGGRLYVPRDQYDDFIAERCRASLTGNVA